MKQDETRGPAIPSIGVMALVPDTWGHGVWMPRHQVLSRLSRYFRIVWVNPAIGWRECLRPGSQRSVFSQPDREIAPGMTVYSHSRLAPKFYKPPFLGRFTETARMRTGVRFLRRSGCTRLVGYLWRPKYASCLWRVPFDVRCYHIDDEYSFSVVDGPVDEYERRLIADVDQVFIHSPALMEKKGRINPRTTYVPNGVDYRSFTTPLKMPVDLAPIPRPVVGYIGVIQSTIDWGLVLQVVSQKPDISFVFVGPEGHLEPEDRKNLEQLGRLRNTHFLGGKPVDRLPAYAQHLDTCIMPYKINGYTKYIFPLKVNEYLAAGKPTIGTPIRTLQDYSEIVDLAESADEWSRALERNLTPEHRSIEKTNMRRSVAQQNDWQIMVDQIAESICELAAREHLSALREMFAHR